MSAGIEKTNDRSVSGSHGNVQSECGQMCLREMSSLYSGSPERREACWRDNEFSDTYAMRSLTAES